MAPPGPVAEVVLINRLTGARTAILPGKVDTGSDVTLQHSNASPLLHVPSCHERGTVRPAFGFLYGHTPRQCLTWPQCPKPIRPDLRWSQSDLHAGALTALLLNHGGTPHP